MNNLALVKSASRLREEQKHSRSFIDNFGLSLRRGTLSEICGEASSGKTALVLSFLAGLTKAGEVCAIVDVSDSFNPEVAFQSGLILENFLWVKCGGNIEKAFTATDYLIHAKGFGAIWINLNNVLPHTLRLIPSSFWYRFRAGVNGSPTLLIVTGNQSILGSASSQSYAVSRDKTLWKGIGRFKLLREFLITLHAKKPMSGRPILTRIRQNFSE